MDVSIDKLGIVEFRNIVTTINQTYNIDFSEYSLTSLKRRFEKIIYLYNFKTPEDLILKLQTDPTFFEIFLKDISVEETEMFRDPPMWQELKETIFPKLVNETDLKIWVPDITSGDELYSLLIILKETFLLEKTKVYATSISLKNIEFCKSGQIDLKKIETNSTNYRRIKGEFQLTKYVDIEDKKAVINDHLYKDVLFLKHDITKEKAPSTFKLILFRNKLIYYNPQLENKIFETIFESLLPGGFLIIGINETLEHSPNADKLQLFNQNENIFKRTI